MPTHVTDARSNFNDQLVYASRVIGRSSARAAVFDAICTGKKKVKTRDEISASTGLTAKQVLDAGKRLAASQIVTQTRKDGQTAYEKDSVYAPQKAKILRLARDPKARDKIPTKVSPRPSNTGFTQVPLMLPLKLTSVKQITLDDIQTFAQVQRVVQRKAYVRMPEKVFKTGIQNLVNEPGTFSDWGGEGNDLFTTRLQVGGKRKATAFAFKGPGKKGKLTPGKMGKNGDQIQRLFRSSAEVFIVQYWSEIDESVLEQMKYFAIAKSALEESSIMYGIIDGADSARIVAAYPKAFQTKE
jgi:hypothetical protein